MRKYRIGASATSIVYAYVEAKSKFENRAVEQVERKAFDHELEFLPAESDEVYDIDINEADVEEV
jgi:hypothetical protein